MPVLKLSTPGVYVQEIPSLPPAVAEVETAIPAFIGYAEKADQVTAGDLLMVPTKISSFSEFIQYYGNAPVETDDSITIAVQDSGNNNYNVLFSYDATKRSKYNLYYALQHFYDNGGGTCYIVAVDTYKTPSAVDKDKLKSGLALIADVDEVTLLAIPEAGKIDDPAAVDLSTNPPTLPPAYTDLVQAMIKQAVDLKDRFAIIDPFMVTPKTPTVPTGNIDKDVSIIRDATLSVSENMYAAAYYPNILSTYPYNYDFDNLTIDSYTLASGVSAPSVSNYQGQKISATGSGSILYNKIKNTLNAELVTLPPSAAIAGLYTRVDNNKGVWKAPANESLLSAVGPNLAISNREQDTLNIDPVAGKSINVIRTFPGFGTLVWGARTLAGNDNEWKYISVRRFFNMVEESVKKSSQWAVFEPNTNGTWVKIQSMIENYLFQKWRDGALAGTKPEQAYYVKVGLGTTMTADDILEGRMIIEIGMAVARPAEFIVLKFTQLMQQS